MNPAWEKDYVSYKKLKRIIKRLTFEYKKMHKKDAEDVDGEDSDSPAMMDSDEEEDASSDEDSKKMLSASILKHPSYLDRATPSPNPPINPHAPSETSPLLAVPLTSVSVSASKLRAPKAATTTSSTTRVDAMEENVEDDCDVGVPIFSPKASTDKFSPGYGTLELSATSSTSGTSGKSKGTGGRRASKDKTDKTVFGVVDSPGVHPWSAPNIASTSSKRPSFFFDSNDLSFVPSPLDGSDSSPFHEAMDPLPTRAYPHFNETAESRKEKALEEKKASPINANLSATSLWSSSSSSSSSALSSASASSSSSAVSKGMVSASAATAFMASSMNALLVTEKSQLPHARSSPTLGALSHGPAQGGKARANGSMNGDVAGAMALLGGGRPPFITEFHISGPTFKRTPSLGRKSSANGDKVSANSLVYLYMYSIYM